MAAASVVLRGARSNLWLAGVLVFYLGRVRLLSPLYAVPQLSPMFVTCVFVCWRALSSAGWTSWFALPLCSLLLGGLQNLAQSALWDTLEPFLVGDPDHGRGVQRLVPQSSQRVTATSSIRGGDPTRGAAASAFTQHELDQLAARGIQPWDPAAQEALKRL